MSGSFALQKLLYAEKELGEHEHRGYHFSGIYEPLLHSAQIDHPGSVTPRSSYRFSSLCLFSSFTASFLMKKSRKEKWWLGLFLMSGLYYCSVKAHKVHNGLVGHQSGFFAAGLGTIGVFSRLIIKSGTFKTNFGLLCFFSTLLWYELGRFHLWSEHASQFRQIISPSQSSDLFGEYFSPSVQVAFLPYRKLS